MAFVVLPFTANAQFGKSEIFASYGVLPASKFLDVAKIELPSTTYLEGSTKYSTNNKKSKGAFNIGYSFHINDKIAVGLAFSYSKTEKDVVIGSSVPQGKQTNKYLVFMPNVKYYWFSAKIVKLYSRVAVGVVSAKANADFIADSYGGKMEMDNKSNSIAWQASPIGIEVGIKPIAAFAEGGFGYMGCAQLGVRFRF